MRKPWWLPFGHVDEVRAEDLHTMVGNGSTTFLLDVREPVEYVSSHIEGARNISIRELDKRLDELDQDKERPIVAICLSGHRSIPAYRVLKRAGWKNVASLHGGMMSWWKSGLPTTRKSAR